ncbi:beta strand repeat-containing protein [Hymenobacter volaticus]|uniref:Right-handed parallel beta-helix repeat-containing protein n=1 Tax=Hymenobacter volaticus TaxID=2932254 RepID=A0ABY4G646_9BACT|nr:right-handed parallel beta-helix repeat-containing protein [Hymenobacter volaticus]UOQ66385.1 right-handed parallel beta-helix repeat-containing protein [Hymenobacter volaticus]
MNRNVTPYTTTQEFDLGVGAGVAATQDFVVNSLAYNPQDGYLYALTYPANNNGDGSGEFPQVRMYRIGQTGVQDLGVTTVDGFTPGTGQPLTRYPQYAAGVIDRNGNYYVTPRNLGASGAANENRNTLFRFRLGSATPLNAERFTLRNAANTNLLNPNTQASTPENTINFIDLGIDPTDNALYGIYFPGLIYRFAVPATAGNTPVTAIGARLTTTDPAYDDNLGTAFFDITGNFYAYSNEGNFYAINKASGVATDIGDVAAAGVSDGASCVNPEQRIDVVKEVISIIPITTAGQYTVDFSIKVRNTGTVTTTNVQVSDFLTGAANNTTFPTATSVTVSNLVVTNSNGAALAANTAYTGQGTNADLLTGNHPLTAGQEATITFRATVSYGSAAAVPGTVQNNTAYASSISGTTPNPGYSLQGANGALILPPGDLVATDASTNSAALPDTPNGDAPSPSPVYFGLAILGNVFEDSNYGGGAGRSQAASNGSGVNQARVELYLANSGSFVVATTTDADGNYSFVDGVNTVDLTANTTYRVRVVNSTVVSNRLGSIAGLWPVQTFINGDVNRVGGENPNEADYGSRSTTLPLSLDPANLALEIQSITPSSGTGSVRTSSNGPIVGVDFGFNFDTVVNTNDSGQGSLRQFITNANNLGNDNLSQAYSGAIAGQEAAIFMLNDGRTNGAPAGLRNNMLAVTGYSAVTKAFTITPASALPTISASNTTIDGARQTAITGDNIAAAAETTTGPEVLLNFNNLAGLLVTGGTTRIENLGLNNARGTSTAATNPVLADGAGVTFSGAATTGSVLNMVTTSGNTTAGARLQGGATNVMVTNNVLNGSAAVGSVNGEGLVLAGASRNTISRNTLSNNSGFGLLLESGQANNENTISSNILRNNGSGANAEDAGLAIGSGNNNLISQNIFSANAGTAVVAAAGTSGNRITQNNMSGHSGLGIDLMATGTTGLSGDGVTRNDNTDADTGPMACLIFRC